MSNEFKGAIFIDRDGTLIEERPYLKDPKDVVVIDGVADAISRLNLLGIPIIVATNQGGIGLGHITWAEYCAVERHIDALLRQQNAHILDTFKCPYHPKATFLYRSENHPNRKPNPGMLLDASATHGIDLTKSWMIGDRVTDLMAGKAAGCKTILVRTGCGSKVDVSLADMVFDTLTTAFDHIRSLHGVM